VYEVWQNNYKFFIHERAFHVIKEAQRVEEILALTEPNAVKLGEFMNESQESLKNNYG